MFDKPSIELLNSMIEHNSNLDHGELISVARGAWIDALKDTRDLILLQHGIARLLPEMAHDPADPMRTVHNVARVIDANGEAYEALDTARQEIADYRQALRDIANATHATSAAAHSIAVRALLKYEDGDND